MQNSCAHQISSYFSISNLCLFFEYFIPHFHYFSILLYLYIMRAHDFYFGSIYGFFSNQNTFSIINVFIRLHRKRVNAFKCLQIMYLADECQRLGNFGLVSKLQDAVHILKRIMLQRKDVSESFQLCSVI